ncbi:MAG: DUF3108 domain-containing protein [Rhizobiaceae bacterium]|nr:DUF3108 domain-containing protein [Rhizobiaceae bacterium]
MNIGAIRTAALAAIMTMPAAGAAAQQLGFEIEYVVTVRSFTVAKATFDGRISGDRFEVDGTLRSAGVARIFDRTEAKSRSVGTLATGTPQPESFLLSYVQGSSPGTQLEIAFQDGTVANVTHEPAFDPTGDDVVPLQKSDLQAVTDPISATIVARGAPDDICRRTLRIYEGGTRVDVQLSPSSVGWVYGAGNGAVTCSAQFIPVAGYIKSETYDYMRQHANMEFVYVPTHRQNIYTLHTITTQTDIGQVKLRAWRTRIDG